MDYQKEVMNEIKDINRIIGEFCAKIKNEHHKEKDGVWSINFNTWSDMWWVCHQGYWLDDIDTENQNLLYALQEFKEKLSKKIKEEIDLYDFKNHCAKEFTDDDEK